MQMDSIKANLEKIKNSLPEGVTLVAVSKTRTADEITEAYNAGQRDFGENKAQELCEKTDVLPSDIRWHFIGHLQTNKVKNVVGRAYLIHSVDSMHLADAIDKAAAKQGMVQSVLVQVNVAGEAQKSGISFDEAEDLCNYIRSSCPNIRLEGLMQVAPDLENQDELRPYFAKLANLCKSLNLDILSMGMSGDYKTAIDEGANMVRIGSAIFGARVYKNSEV